MINSWLTTSVVPLDFKHAVIERLLKKNPIWTRIRPVSKLLFLCKILVVYNLMQVVCQQFQLFLKTHGVLNSTETTLLKVFNVDFY